jgi:hypothetical protein
MPTDYVGPLFRPPTSHFFDSLRRGEPREKGEGIMTALSRAFFIALLLVGCVQLPPTPLDLQAKKFAAVPGQAVIYLVRDLPDFSDLQAQVNLGGKLGLRTYPGTYYRWEVQPGTHQIDTGFYDTGRLTLEVRAGGIYFVQQRVLSIMGNPSSTFELVGETAGRAAVTRAVLLVPDS